MRPGRDRIRLSKVSDAVARAFLAIQISQSALRYRHQPDKETSAPSSITSSICHLSVFRYFLGATAQPVTIVHVELDKTTCHIICIPVIWGNAYVIWCVLRSACASVRRARRHQGLAIARLWRYVLRTSARRLYACGLKSISCLKN